VTLCERVQNLPPCYKKVTLHFRYNVNSNTIGIRLLSASHFFRQEQQPPNFTMDLVQLNLRQTASLANFQSTPIDEFRNNFDTCLRNVVTACSRQCQESVIIQIDENLLALCMSEIDWTKLCKCHAQTPQQQPSSCLQVIIRSFRNPFVWPACCWGPLTRTFASLVSNNKVPDTARSIVLETIVQVASTSCKLLQSAFGVTLLSAMDDQNICSLSRSVSLVNYWAKVFPAERPSLMSTVYQLMSKIDNLQAFSSSLVNSQHRMPKRCMFTAKLDHLHDGLCEGEEERLVRKLQMRQPRTKPRPSFKSILLEKTSQQRYSQHQLDKVRAKAIHVGSKVADDLPPPLAARAIEQALNQACTLPQSSACSRCFVVALASKFNMYHEIVNQIWNRVEASSNQQAVFLLGFFCEILAECSIFDDLQALWQGMLPLINKLYIFCQDAHDNPANNDSGRTTIFLRCFSYILTRRGNMLSWHSEFASLTAVLSLTFGNAAYWFHASLSEQQCDSLFQTLQKAGVFGISDGLLSLDWDQVKSDDNLFTEPWPFSFDNSLRRVGISVDPFLKGRSLSALLSCLSPSNGVSEPTLTTGITLAGAAKAVPGDVHIMTTLNDDLIHHVFSFLDYKNLQVMRTVCKEWQTIADRSRMWNELFLNCFGFEKDDVMAKNYNDDRWKEHFKGRWIIERENRFKCSKTGWKYRVCGYVGCLQTLRSESQYKKHNCQRSKRATRKRPRTASAQTRTDIATTTRSPVKRSRVPNS
jgi:hypothetical protein